MSVRLHTVPTDNFSSKSSFFIQHKLVRRLLTAVPLREANPSTLWVFRSYLEVQFLQHSQPICFWNLTSIFMYIFLRYLATQRNKNWSTNSAQKIRSHSGDISNKILLLFPFEILIVISLIATENNIEDYESWDLVITLQWWQKVLQHSLERAK